MTLEEIRELVSQSQAADNEAVALHKDFRSKVNTPLEAEAWIKLNAATRNCAVLDDKLLGMSIESVVYAADEAIAEARKQAFLEGVAFATKKENSNE